MVINYLSFHPFFPPFVIPAKAGIHLSRCHIGKTFYLWPVGHPWIPAGVYPREGGGGDDNIKKAARNNLANGL